MGSISNEIVWEAPGPGSWLLLADHFPKPVTPEYALAFIETMPPANTMLASRYGIPLAGLDAGVVHGCLYLRPVPLVGAGANALPPPWLLWLGARAHPKLRACAKAARRVLAERPWLAVVDDWELTTRARWIDRDLTLQRVEPAALDDAALADHLLRCRAAWRDGYRLHFELHGSDQLPIAAYVVRGEQWGHDRHELLDALTGWSPASTGDDERLVALRRAVRAATGEAEVPASLDEVRALGPDVVAALDAYLDHFGWRLVTSYDLEGRALIELPSLIIARLRRADAPEPSVARARSAAVGDHLRAAVPGDDLDEFDRLLADARRTYGLRDDNGGLLGAWPVGLTRRTYLEAGRRLAASRHLQVETHVFELIVDEVVALLRGQPAPGRDDVSARAARRVAAGASGPPLALGRPMSMPDATVLPAAMALMTAAQVLLAADTGLTSTDRVEMGDGRTIGGTGIGATSVEGIARVADDPVEVLGQLEAGDILVVASTNPGWNAILPLLTAIVVEEGGALSHAAIMCRELALPGVIGAAGATTSIHTGDRVIVDAAAGTVQVIS